MTCEKCGVSVGSAPLFRTGRKGPGEHPHWRCEWCMDRAPDLVLTDVTDAIVADNLRHKMRPHSNE